MIEFLKPSGQDPWCFLEVFLGIFISPQYRWYHWSDKASPERKSCWKTCNVSEHRTPGM